MLLLQRLYVDGVPGPIHLFFEGILAAFLGTAFAAWLFPSEASLVAVFLAALTASDSMERMLDWNRWAIQKRGVPPGKANLRLATLLLSLFVGTLWGFTVVGLVLPLDTLADLFSRQLGGVELRSFATLEFGHALPLFLNNLYVIAFFFFIAIPFRRGGIMLAIAWNASGWGLMSAALARAWADQSGRMPARAVLDVVLATTPHLAMEAGAYVLAGLAGVFLSKALERHKLGSLAMVSIMRTVALLFGIAVGLVALGATVEGFLAPHVVRALVAG